MTDPVSEGVLEPCPFCGDNRASVERDAKHSLRHTAEYLVVCNNPKCRARGPRVIADDYGAQVKYSITAWNTRLASPINSALVEALERWSRNLKITRNSPVHGDILHGPALDLVIEGLDSILATANTPPEQDGSTSKGERA